MAELRGATVARAGGAEELGEEVGYEANATFSPCRRMHS